MKLNLRFNKKNILTIGQIYNYLFYDQRHGRSPNVYFPKTSKEGVIKFIDGCLWFLNGKFMISPYNSPGGTQFKTYNVIHTLIHEIDPCLDLSHYEGPEHNKTVMYFYSNKVVVLPNYDVERTVSKYGSREGAHLIHYTRMKNWIKVQMRRFGTIEIQNQEINYLREKLESLKEQLKMKD